MLHIKKLDEGVELFKALGSELRINILKLLLEHKEMNMNELATRLGITNGALTSHIKKMEEVGLITVLSERGGHGNQKLCRVGLDKILVDIQQDGDGGEENICETEIPIGHYSDYQIYPTCGLATTSELVGQVDDPGILPTPSASRRGCCGLPRATLRISSPMCCPRAPVWSRLPCRWKSARRRRG